MSQRILSSMLLGRILAIAVTFQACNVAIACLNNCADSRNNVGFDANGAIQGCAQHDKSWAFKSDTFWSAVADPDKVPVLVCTDCARSRTCDISDCYNTCNNPPNGFAQKDFGCDDETAGMYGKAEFMERVCKHPYSSG
jgi:hypothetical protein